MNTTLRYWEYYDMQGVFDELYKSSSEGNNFRNLYELITSRENILLAYRSIKSNKGSKTEGTDEITIDHFKNMEQDQFVDYIRQCLTNYKPKTVRRVYIPKENGDKRPLGIPSIRDRIIQQMFKQILEPICEAKFYKHSYGFRPVRSASNAIARCLFLSNRHDFHYVVDVDIKSFFDNVNHKILRDQLWNMGIRDKRVLAIIGKMLKAPIKGVGVPTKGTPQGGILSPLLANVYLNDLDQWVSSQWEEFPTQHQYSNNSKKYRALKTTNLKEGFLVRYADDFKIFTRNRKQALRWFHAVKGYLKDRLKLDIAPDKSKVCNIRRRPTEFLGIELKAVKKKSQYIIKSNVRDKKKKQIISSAKKRVIEMTRKGKHELVHKYNSFVLGLHNYFKIATHCNDDFAYINYTLSRLMYNRFKGIGKYKYPNDAPDAFKRFYLEKNGKCTFKTFQLNGIYLFPLFKVTFTKPLNFSQEVTPYTEQGRKNLYKDLNSAVKEQIRIIMNSNTSYGSAEYLDNRLSRYSMKNGKCEITKEFLLAEDIHCHHYLPRSLGGKDNFNNLRIIHRDVHALIHAKKSKTIEHYLGRIKPDKKQLVKINQFRKVCNLLAIDI